MARVLLIGTRETKEPAIAALGDALVRHGLDVEVVDVSLGAGISLSGAEKVARMQERSVRAAVELASRCGECSVAIGIGGGTGGEIVLGALKGLPAEFPKLLLTTLAFDPRAALADTAITLIPTLCDIEGRNALLAQTFENAAAMAAGLARARRAPGSGRLSVGITTMGATGPAGVRIAAGLEAEGLEPVVFHANGYGGAAFARFAGEGRFGAVIDLTTHELGRIRLAGAHVPMPGRFDATRDRPRVVLTGGLNFLGLGPPETIAPDYLARPHYRHTGQFTHVKLTEGEMADQSVALAAALNRSRAPCTVLVPMGGFSHEDRTGGAIEDRALREIAADELERAACAYTVRRLPDHINDAPVAAAAISALTDALSHKDAS